MKNRYSLLALIMIFAFISTSAAQEPTDVYRRSSICMIFMDEPNSPNRNVIREAFLTASFPEKYNNHNISNRSFDPSKLSITGADREAYKKAVNLGNTETASGEAPKKKGGGGFGKAMKQVGSQALGAASGSGQSAVVDNSDKETHAITAHKHLMEEKVAKQLFDKWFLSENGDFHMDLIKERGMYDATIMDVQTAQNSVRGMGMLEDAGEELVNNTFVVVSRFFYMSKDDLVKEIDAIAQQIGAQFGEYGQLAASGGTAALKASLGAGYYVKSTSYLFQLRWNEDVAHTFYSELWDNPQSYNASDIFSLKYIGEETAWANVKAGIFTNKPESELIRIATVNATDAVLAKLEKKYDVFKTKTPLLTTDPLTASFGMKEGLEAGDKYEVLEKTVNTETGKTVYKRKTVLTVEKGGIWDNRYMASEEMALSGETQMINATRLKGSSNGLYPGMLLRQIK